MSEIRHRYLEACWVMIHNAEISMGEVAGSGGVVKPRDYNRIYKELIINIAKIFGQNLTAKEATCVLKKVEAERKKNVVTRIVEKYWNAYISTIGHTYSVGWTAVEILHGIWAAQNRAGIAPEIVVPNVEMQKFKSYGEDSYDIVAKTRKNTVDMEEELLKYMEVFL